MWIPDGEVRRYRIWWRLERNKRARAASPTFRRFTARSTGFSSQLSPSLAGGLPESRQHPIAIQLRDNPGVPQTFRHFVGHIASAGEFVRRAGVMKQPAFALEHPGHVVIEDLRVEFSGDTKTRRVVQNTNDRPAGQHGDSLGDVALG